MERENGRQRKKYRGREGQKEATRERKKRREGLGEIKRGKGNYSEKDIFREGKEKREIEKERVLRKRGEVME